MVLIGERKRPEEYLKQMLINFNLSKAKCDCCQISTLMHLAHACHFKGVLALDRQPSFYLQESLLLSYHCLFMGLHVWLSPVQLFVGCRGEMCWFECM